MAERGAEVLILILTYNGRADVLACLASLQRDRYSGTPRRIVVADNASTDGTLQAVRAEHPDVETLVFQQNLGFAGGNERAWWWIAGRWPEAKVLVLLNQDTLVEPGWLEPLLAAMEGDNRLACVQAKLRLHPATDRINSAGNRSHYLGFGYSLGAGQVDRGQHDTPGPIDFPSGAAMAVRTAVLRELGGLFEPGFFAYLEDAELGWRLRQAGLRVGYEPRSVVYHKHTFDTTLRQYEHLERNRWWLLLVYYRWRTLLLLAPALLAMELGQLGYALAKGMPRAKLRAWGGIVRPGGLRRVLSARRTAQRRRVIGDRVFMGGFTGRIDFEPIDRGLVRWVANPLFAAYWRCVRGLIRW